MHEKLDDPEFGCRLHVLGQPCGAQLAGIDVHSRARLEQVDRHQADDQADHRQPEEQQHGLAQQAPERALVAHPGNAGDDGAEHHRGNHHLHQFDEGIPQWLEGDGLLAPEMPDHDT
ncbi:hypothetical protein D3C81_1548490 [compost metagenome]